MNKHSLRVNDRYSKAYKPCYRKHGKWVVADEVYRTRTEAEERGAQLQLECDNQATKESSNLLAALRAKEAAIGVNPPLVEEIG